MTRNRILWSGEESDFSMQYNSLWPRKPSRCLRYNIDSVLTRSDETFTVRPIEVPADKDAHRTLNCRVLVRQPALWSRQQHTTPSSFCSVLLQVALNPSICVGEPRQLVFFFLGRERANQIVDRAPCSLLVFDFRTHVHASLSTIHFG
jgi:hypothetical protein